MDAVYINSWRWRISWRFLLRFRNKNLLTWPERLIYTHTCARKHTRLGSTLSLLTVRVKVEKGVFTFWRPKWSQWLLRDHDALWYTVGFNDRNAFEGSRNECVLCLCMYCMCGKGQFVTFSWSLLQHESPSHQMFPQKRPETRGKEVFFSFASTGPLAVTAL